MKKILLGILLCYPLITFAAQDNAYKAKSFADQNAKKVLEIIESGLAEDAKKIKLTNLFLDIMDTEWMGKFVLGKYWSIINQSEQSTFQSSYKRYLVSLYVSKYTDYNKNTYNIYSTSSLGNGQYIVSMNINSQNSSAPIKVEYRIKDYGSYLKVRDIIAEGVSLISTERSDFSSFLSNHSIEELIKTIQAKKSDVN